MAARWLGRRWSWWRPRTPPAPVRPRRERVTRYFDCTWPGPWRDERARVSSLSPTGCYVETRLGVPATGTAIHDLAITLPTGTVLVHGIVIDAIRSVGFAVRFTDVDPEIRQHLSALGQDQAFGPSAQSAAR